MSRGDIDLPAYENPYVCHFIIYCSSILSIPGLTLIKKNLMILLLADYCTLLVLITLG